VLTRETRNCVAREMGSARTRATHHDPVFFFPISSETALPRCPVAGEGCGERRARCVVRDGLPTASGRTPKWCFWVTIARRAEYSSLEERLRARGARDPGFDDGRVGRTSVPWVAREYLADAGTNATRANRAELSSIGTRSHLCPNQKKIFSARPESSHTATRLLSNLESANFLELLESQTLPQILSSFRVCKRRTGGAMCVCPSAAPGDARRVFRVAETSATPFLAAFAHVDGHSRVRRAWRARRGFGTDSRPPGRCRTRPTRLFPAVSAAE
jgi:hypothetical protein